MDEALCYNYDPETDTYVVLDDEARVFAEKHGIPTEGKGSDGWNAIFDICFAKGIDLYIDDPRPLSE